MPERSRLPRDLFLRRRHFLERHLQAEIAARHHDALRDLQDVVEMIQRLGPLDLRDQRNVRGAGLGQNLPRLPHVVCAAHEAQRHHVDAELGAELADRRCPSASARRRELHARRVDALVLVQHSAVDHRRHDFLAVRPLDLQLNLSVIDQQQPAGLDLRTSSAYVV